MQDATLPVGIGDSVVQQRFIKSHEAFVREFPRILTLFNKMFSMTLERYNAVPEVTATGQDAADEISVRLAQIIVHYLARTIFDAFGDLLLLAANGRGFGAMMILRPMYEHLVTAAFIAQNPGEAKVFDDNARLQKGKIWNRIVAVVPSAKNALTLEDIQEIEAAFAQAKAQQKIDTCNKCGQPKTVEAWTRVSVDDMARRVDEESGSDLAKLYGPCFLIPTAFIHPTPFGLELRSGKIDDGNGLVYRELSEPEAHTALLRGHGMLLRVLKLQNSYFKLDLDGELAARWRAFPPIWGGAEAGPS